jgi:hypothetical protein
MVITVYYDVLWGTMLSTNTGLKYYCLKVTNCLLHHGSPKCFWRFYFVSFLPSLFLNMVLYQIWHSEPYCIFRCLNFLHIVYLQLVALNAGGQAVLLESIISNLLSFLNDPSPIVRQLCLKGLSSVSHLAQEQVSSVILDGFTILSGGKVAGTRLCQWADIFFFFVCQNIKL